VEVLELAGSQRRHWTSSAKKEIGVAGMQRASEDVDRQKTAGNLPLDLENPRRVVLESPLPGAYFCNRPSGMVRK
jgi:hypothetical protein